MTNQLPVWWNWPLAKLEVVHRSVKRPGFRAFFRDPREVKDLRDRIAFRRQQSSQRRAT